MAKKKTEKTSVSNLKRRSRAEIGKIPPEKVVPSAREYRRKKKHSKKDD